MKNSTIVLVLLLILNLSYTAVAAGLPARPTGVTVTASISGNIITWNPAARAKQYNVYWSNIPGVIQTTWTKIENVTSGYIHMETDPYKSYYYVVTAMNDSGESPVSAEVGIETTEPKFIAVGSAGTILSSIDGISWVQQKAVVAGTLFSVKWFPQKHQFIAVGDNGTIITSDNGITWKQQISYTKASLTDIEWTDSDHGKYVVTGVFIIMTSIDSINWKSRFQIYSTTDYYLASVTSDNENIIMVAGGNASSGFIYISPDWETRLDMCLFVGPGSQLYDVIWDKYRKQFVAIGSVIEANAIKSIVYTSPDSITWTKRDTGTANVLKHIAYNKNLYVVTGERGLILTSPDSITWTVQNSGTSEWLMGVEWSATTNEFIIVGGNGTILRSNDGITWTQAVSGTTKTLYSVTCR